MRKKGYKGRCEKKDLSKSQEVCKTYDAIQSTYADILQNDNGIQEIRCNVLMDGLAEGAYTPDFVCIKADGDLMVRECVFRKFLTKPMTVKLLDASRDCWLKHGVSDGGALMKKNNSFPNNQLLQHDNQLVRVLDSTTDKVFIIDCIKRTMPVWTDAPGNGCIFAIE